MESKKNSTQIYEVVISLTALILFGVLFTVTELFKVPFVVYASILLVLYPFKKSKLIKIIISLSTVIFLLWFIHSISGIIIPFIISFLLAYVLNPVTEMLERRKISRTTASLILLVAVIIIITVILIFVVPIVVTQFSDFLKTLPDAMSGLQNWVTTTLLPKLEAWGIPTSDLKNKIGNEMPGKIGSILTALLGGLSGIFTGLSVVMTQLINLILLPFLTFYLLKDFKNLKMLVKKLLPKNHKQIIVSYFHKVDNLLGGFIRGALTVALIHAILATLFLTLIGVKYAIFLGALSGLLDLIPYFGLLISLVIGTIVAIFSGNPSIQVPLTIGCYIGLNILENSYLAPKIIGGKIGLHPALLILSLMVFSYFFGFIGLLIALPTMSIIILFFNEWLDKREPI